MTCRKCKKETPQDALFCPFCGVSLQVMDYIRKPRTRPNGAGTAFKRGKTWTARVVVAWKPREGLGALPIYRSKGGFATKREALEYCAALKNDKPRKAPKLIEYWQMYEKGELVKLSKSKQAHYRAAWKRLSALHYRPVEQITVAELRNAVSKATSTHYTASDCKSLLSALYKLAGADGWCSKDLPSYIILPRLNEKERQTFTTEEQAALWKVYEAGDIRAAVPLLMICTGMMPGEMMRLRVEHIDLDGHKIIGVGMKTDVRRKSPVYLPDDAIPIVEDMIAHAKNGRICTYKKRWYANYYAVLEAAGCRKLEPYCCRHTTATRLAISEGVAPQTVRRMMRWSNTRMLDRYAHPDDDAVFQAANKLKKPGH